MNAPASFETTGLASSPSVSRTQVWFTTSISIAGFLLGFYLVVLQQIGRFDTQVLVAMTKHTEAMWQFMAEALGYSIALPFLVTVLLILFPFKSRKQVFHLVYPMLVLAVSLINLSAAFSDGTIK